MVSAHHLLASTRYFYRMKQKLSIFFVVFICGFTVLPLNAGDHEYQQKLKKRLSIQAQEVFVIYKLADDLGKTPQVKAFPDYEETEVDLFLKEKFGKWYDGYDPLISEYISFYTSQPHQHIRIWFGLNEFFAPRLIKISDESRVVLSALAFSQSMFLPYTSEKENKGLLHLKAPIALYFDCLVTENLDERVIVEKNIHVADLYLKQLGKKFATKPQSLAAFMLGASTVNKAKVTGELAQTYWELYPFLKSENRDFYPAMLAASFVWAKRKEWKMEGFEFENKIKTRQITVEDSLHFSQISTVLEIDEKELFALNPKFIKQIVCPKNKIYLPKEKADDFLEMKDSIYNFKRDEFFPKKNDSCYVFYRTKPGDYFRDLTFWFGQGIEEIKNHNRFASNTLKKNWDVFFKVPCADSVFFASFDNLSRAQKDAIAKGSPPPQNTTITEDMSNSEENEKPSGMKITYTVKSGDSLWAIGQKHKVSDKDIMKWNNIGTNIKPGQKLIIYLP